MNLTGNDIILLNITYTEHTNFPFSSNDKDIVILTNEYTPEYIKESNLYKLLMSGIEGDNISIPKFAFPVWLDNFESVNKLDNFKDDDIIIAFLRVFNYWDCDCKSIMETISNYNLFIDVIVRNLEKINYDWLIEFFDPRKLKGVKAINKSFLIWNYYGMPDYPEDIEKKFHSLLFNNVEYFSTIILLNNTKIRKVIDDAKVLKTFLDISYIFNETLIGDQINFDELSIQDGHFNFLCDSIEDSISSVFLVFSNDIIDKFGIYFEFYDENGNLQKIQKYLLTGFLNGCRLLNDYFPLLLPLFKKIMSSFDEKLIDFIILYQIDVGTIEDYIEFNRTKSLLIAFLIMSNEMTLNYLNSKYKWDELESLEWEESNLDDDILTMLQDLKYNVEFLHQF